MNSGLSVVTSKLSNTSPSVESFIYMLSSVMNSFWSSETNICWSQVILISPKTDMLLIEGTGASMSSLTSSVDIKEDQSKEVAVVEEPAAAIISI